jgi:hypothetical protein
MKFAMNTVGRSSGLSPAGSPAHALEKEREDEEGK